MMDSWYGYGHNGGWMLFGPIFWIIFLGVAIYFIVWWFHENQGNRKERTSLDILKERYVRWEITKEQFEAMKKDIAE